jgi:hypothetical protein
MMQQEVYNRIREGVVGQFAPALDPPVERHLSGYLKLNEDDVLAKLIADDAAFDDKGFPIDCRAVFGRTEAGDVLMVDIRSRGHDRGNLDVARYKSSSLLVDLHHEEVEHDTVIGIQFAYHGLYNWLSHRIYHDDTIVEDGKLVGWKAELRYGKGTTVPLDDGFTLRFSAGWQIDGAFDRRTFATPLTITVESDRRRPIGDHILRLDAVHALLNIAHREPVRSFGGSAKLSADSEWCGFWDTSMMSTAAADADTQSFPYFGLEDIGGLNTVANWVRTVHRHRRAVAPLVRHVLDPNQTPEARLLSTAAAMESWVAAHRRTQDWAKKVKGEDLPGALIRKVDRSWDTWIGDSDAWLDSFWSSYNHLKHQPEDDLDPHFVHMLEISGRWLLTATLLDQAAGSLAPSRHLFGKSLSMLGADVRKALATAS